MRIDSSTIGMDSTRSFSSISGRVSKFMMTDSRKAFGETSTETPAETPTETPTETLSSTLEEMSAKMKAFNSGSVQNLDAEEIKKQMMEIRQQCLDFLMNILFPERRTSSSMLTEQGDASQAGTDEEDADATSTGILDLTTSTSPNLISAIGLNVRTFAFSRQYYYEETENTAFSTQGTVKCADGRELNFNLNVEMSRSFQEYYEENISYMEVSMCDPLVINLNGNIAGLSDQTFLFDIDADGEQDEISKLVAGSGFLALDKNEDGTINDGSELFGTKSGNGFADLAAYDDDQNGFIDEGDEIWNRLKIWVMDENGEPQLCSLADKGVGAIALMNKSTDFSLTNDQNQTNGMIRNTGFFLYENGNAGTVQHVDMTKHNRTEQALLAYDLYSEVI